MGSILDVKDDYVLVLRSQFFEYLREMFYRHALECMGPVFSENKNKNKKDFFLWKRLTILSVQVRTAALHCW